MKKVLLKQLAIVTFGLIFFPQAMASNAVMTESLTDKLKCAKSNGEPICSVETTGKFTMTAKISGDDFAAAGIYLDEIDQNTPMEVAVGDFILSTALSDADKYKLTATKISAKWSEYASKCLNADCSKTKAVRHTMVTINGGLRGVTIKIVGSSLSSENNEYGARSLADMCDDAGNDAVLTVPATLTVDGIELATTISGRCQNDVRSVSKNGEAFQLQRTLIKAKN